MSERLSLRKEELTALHEGMTDLLTPAAHEDLYAWRSSFVRSIGTALGADWGLSVIRDPRVVESFSPDKPRAVEYIGRSEPFEREIAIWQRQAELGVWNRPMLWGKYLEAMYRSSYYNEFARPLRAFDTIGLTIHQAGQPLTSLHFMHQSPRGRKFGKRGLMLLKLLEPAMRVGSAAALRHFGLMHEASAATASDVPAVTQPAVTQPAVPLSPREHEVAHLLARRKTNREIGEALGISPATAKRHIENILMKLGISSRRAVERLMER